MQKTPNCLMVRVSPAGRQTTQTAVMTIRLKAADPTIVDGPSAPLLKPSFIVSITERRISGADEPKAIRVRLATVEFQTRTWKVRSSPVPLSFFLIDFSFDVSTSIDVMKTSAPSATPRKIHRRMTSHRIMRPPERGMPGVIMPPGQQSESRSRWIDV